MENETVSVLIVGGGPVGLSAALFLARLGVRPLLIERRAATSNHPRARGINYRTMELFRTVGLETAIRQAGAALAHTHSSILVKTLAGKEIRRFGGLEEDTESNSRIQRVTPTTFCLCAQDELEPLLLQAGRQSGAEIRFDTELVALTQDESGVTATVLEQVTNTQRIIRSNYLLATDGANSFVRRQLDIKQNGRGTIGYYVGIYFRSDLSALVRGREFAMCFVNNPAAHGTISSVNNTDRWVFNVEYDPTDGTTTTDFTPARCIELVREAIGLPELEVELLSVQPWEAALKIADTYQKGRVFLAGDAVHVMPPAGAFGMNTGIQDVHNLAWKLAAVLHEQAPVTLLTSYTSERRPVGKVTVEQAGLRLDFRARKPDAADTSDKPKLLDDLAIILGYRYNLLGNAEQIDPIPEELDLSGQLGTRAPHVWLKRNGISISTLDLFTTNFVLLTGEDSADWRETANKLALAKGLKLDIYSIGEHGDLQDPAGNWATAYGINEVGAVLVRPDGFVAWRSPAAVTSTGQQQLTQSFELGN